MGVLRSEVTLYVPATEDSLPLVRQALRSIGETTSVEPETLEDVELAVTEACANAIEHAYEEGGGEVRVELLSDAQRLDVGVVDHGVGIRDFAQRGDGTRGFGLEMIRGIATKVEFRPGDGTDLRMEFALGEPRVEPVDGAIPGIEPAERIMRRLVAVVAAQLDMSSERVVEALLLSELVARNALRYLIGDSAEVRIDHAGLGFRLTVGPLEPGGGDAVVADSDVPVVGPVVAKLANEVAISREEAGEYLSLRVDPR